MATERTAGVMIGWNESELVLVRLGSSFSRDAEMKSSTGFKLSSASCGRKSMSYGCLLG